MGMQINTNVSALNAYRNLSSTQNDLSKSLEKLSSGLRINRAADDAAGLAISEGLRSQINGLNVAARNAQDGISVIQTAEGALSEVHSILQRMRDLAVQAGNDSNNTESRMAIETEVTALKDELSRIAGSSNFNGIKLLDGTAGAAGNGVLKFQVGADGDAVSQISVDLSGANIDTVVTAIGFGAGNVRENATISAADLTTFFGGANATDRDLQFTAGGTQITVDVSAATDAASLAKALNEDSAFAANFTAEVVDNAGVFDLKVTSKVTTDGTSDITVASDTAVDGTFAAVTSTAGQTTVGLADAAGAQLFLNAVDTAITSVSSARADLGAVQNRFESTINSLNVSAENLSAAESRIRDTDMASEMVKFTSANILSQAGTAMLAQANQANQGVLQLLR